MITTGYRLKHLDYTEKVTNILELRFVHYFSINRLKSNEENNNKYNFIVLT